jgi:tetratricopeptide (TPR) repeat protein
MTPQLLVLSVLLLVLLPGGIGAQERWLRGVVVRLGEHNEKLPEANLPIRLYGHGNPTHTDSYGAFRLTLPDVFKAGEKVTLEVDKPDWRIHYPLEGETRVPADLAKEVVEVRLAPTGSKVFLTPDALEKLVLGLSEKAKQQVTPEGQPEKIDLSRYIKDWAVKYGFGVQQVQAEVDKWVAEVENNQNDPYKLGLAAFAKKNFGEASKLFYDSAEQKAKRLEEVKQKEQQLTEEVVRDYRLAGDAHYSNYAFDSALHAYQQALHFASREQMPTLWAATMVDIGRANNELGIRAFGIAIHSYLSAAVTAYQQALEVLTRAHLPQGWAMTQNNLGTALQAQGSWTDGVQGVQLLADAVTAYQQALEVLTRESLPQQWATTQNNLGTALAEQGKRTGGAQGVQLLADAVTAYQQALEVRTREHLPQGWAMTQNNLGIALRNQGSRTGGAQGVQLLADAVTAFQQALEVYTREHLPLQWAQTHNNLARTYVALEDWPNAAASYANVLQIYPDYTEAYEAAGRLYHEVLFQFPIAFALNQQWVERHPEDWSALSGFAEKHFTTGRFAECAERLATLLANPAIESRVQVALQALAIANLLARNQGELVPGTIETLLERIAAQPEDFRVNWAFAGTRHFISQHPGLAPHRAWLQQFFDAVEGQNRQAILAGLQAARAAFAPGGRQ